MPTLEQQLEWWTKQANHDIEIARSNRANGFHDGCALMCQQATEKFLKALYMKQMQSTSPKTHNCEHLATLLQAPADVIDASRLVESDYMEARYPDAAQGVPFELFDDDDSEKRIEATSRVQQWVSQQLNPNP